MMWRHGNCKRPPLGWFCTLDAGHTGPCPTVARWWNWRGRSSGEANIADRQSDMEAEREKAIQIAIGGQTMDFSEHFNRISHEEQINRMRFFADLIVAIARAVKPFGALSSDEIVDVLAARFDVPESDVNYGLLYAIRSRRLVVSDVSDGQYIV